MSVSKQPLTTECMIRSGTNSPPAENTDLIPLLADYNISPRGYHPPSCQCFGTDMVY